MFVLNYLMWLFLFQMMLQMGGLGKDNLNLKPNLDDLNNGPEDSDDDEMPDLE